MTSLNLFSDLQFSFDATHFVNEKNHRTVLQISGNDMEGQVQQVELERDLVLYCWNMHALRPHSSVFEFRYKEERAYMLVYCFQPPNDRLKFIVEGGPVIYAKEKPFLLLYSNNQPLTTHFSKTSRFQCLGISFTHSWLLGQLCSLKENQIASDYLLQLLASPHQRPLSRGETILSKALFNELQGTAFTVEVKAHLYNLITYLYRQVRIHARKDSNTHYRTILLKVEKRIMSSLYTNLPPINELAKEFYMSFSTLNRQFKDKYGVTIYDYYLEQKMLLAQKLLKEGNQSVNAVAFQLGYESVTHFISIFKKIHGYSPGRSKKVNEQQ